MKIKRAVTISLFGLVGIVSFTSAWLIRGLYDEVFLWMGHIHIISHLDTDHFITLEFPSGEKRVIELAEKQSVDLKVSNTGEGSITVYVDETIIDRVGYVTSWNNPIVLSIKKDGVTFSQLFKK